MNAGKIYPYLSIAVIVFLTLGFIIMMRPKPYARQEANQQGQPAVEKLYEVYYYPNRMVIRVNSFSSDHTRKAVTEIEKKYDIENIINQGPMGFEFTKIIIIAIPKDPNSPLP